MTLLFLAMAVYIVHLHRSHKKARTAAAPHTSSTS
jgi:hypothetical protein